MKTDLLANLGLGVDGGFVRSGSSQLKLRGLKGMQVIDCCSCATLWDRRNQCRCRCCLFTCSLLICSLYTHFSLLSWPPVIAQAGGSDKQLVVAGGGSETKENAAAAAEGTGGGGGTAGGGGGAAGGGSGGDGTGLDVRMMSEEEYLAHCQR